MWALNIPADRLWRLLPWVLVVLVCLWGLIHPRSQWWALWGRRERYRNVTSPAERARIVRSTTIVPLLLAVLGMVMLWPDR